MISVFTDRSGNFSEERYRKFFIKAFRWKIKRFFQNARVFTAKLIYHIHSVEAGKNQMSRYFLDLTILLCSGINTNFRRTMIDNSRANVDIRSADLDVVFKDMEYLSKIMSMKEKNEPFVAPCDFTLLYNVLDYVAASFKWQNRKFNDLTIFEAKHPKTTKKDDKQILRERRQIERGMAVSLGFNNALDRIFHKPIYLTDDTIKKLKRQKSVEIDDVFTLELSQDLTARQNKDFWTMDFIEETVCGSISPAIFRGLRVGFIDYLMRNQAHLYIMTRKDKFKEHLTGLPFVKKIAMDSNPYNGYIYVNSSRNKGRISLANLIQAKYPIEKLKIYLSEVLG